MKMQRTFLIQNIGFLFYQKCSNVNLNRNIKTTLDVEILEVLRPCSALHYSVFPSDKAIIICMSHMSKTLISALVVTDQYYSLACYSCIIYVHGLQCVDRKMYFSKDIQRKAHISANVMYYKVILVQVMNMQAHVINNMNERVNIHCYSRKQDLQHMISHIVC